MKRIFRTMLWLVLERAMAMGSAHAAFRLTETYDERVLAAWRVYGRSAATLRRRSIFICLPIGATSGRPASDCRKGIACQSK
jgi:hypothetical protein